MFHHIRPNSANTATGTSIRMEFAPVRIIATAMHAYCQNNSGNSITVFFFIKDTAQAKTRSTYAAVTAMINALSSVLTTGTMSMGTVSLICTHLPEISATVKNISPENSAKDMYENLPEALPAAFFVMRNGIKHITADTAVMIIFTGYRREPAKFCNGPHIVTARPYMKSVSAVYRVYTPASLSCFML